MKKRFFKITGPMNLYREGGGDMVGNYGVGGKIWHGLGQLKNHYLHCLQVSCNWAYEDVKYLKESGKIVQLIPDSNIVIEYELVEVRRFPAKELFDVNKKNI